jgi:hypothetical protein
MQAYLITHLEIRIKRCPAEVFLNRIPIKRLLPNQQLSISVPAMQYLRQTQNLLEVVIFPGPEPARCRESGGVHDTKGASVRARVVTYRDGEFTGGDTGDVICEVKWEGKGSESTPIILSASGAGTPTAGPWAWETASVLSLERDGEAIHAEIRKIHELFKNGNAVELLNKMRTFIKESARAYPAWDIKEIEATLLRDISRNSERKDQIEDLDPQRFSLRLCAEGRLVECIDKDWLPIFRTKPQADGRGYPFPVFLGRTATGLEILR